MATSNLVMITLKLCLIYGLFISLVAGQDLCDQYITTPQGILYFNFFAISNLVSTE